jgi:hypothetical protein
MAYPARPDRQLAANALEYLGPVFAARLNDAADSDVVSGHLFRRGALGA